MRRDGSARSKGGPERATGQLNECLLQPNWSMEMVLVKVNTRCNSRPSHSTVWAKSDRGWASVARVSRA